MNKVTRLNKEQTKEYKDLLLKYRRDLHKIPEISDELPKTKEYLLKELKPMKCQIIPLLNSGLAAFFDFGKKSAIGYRADMDALPIEEANDVDYKSTHKGNCHACGHDGHMAMCLGLCHYINTLDDCPQNVLIIFQPAEETTGGAKFICETGIMEKYALSRIFGFHMWPFAEEGSINTRPGALQPKSAEIRIKIHGKAAHATAPTEAVDALFIACQYVANVDKAHKRFLPENPIPEERTIIQVCKMESGTARNIISGYTFLLGTLRAFDEDRFEALVNILKEQGKLLEKEYDCSFDIWHSYGYAPVINDVNLYNEIEPILMARKFNKMPEPAMISEDYSYYGFHAPSVFFFLGTGTGIALHSNNFDFNEYVLLEGLKLYIDLLY